MNWRSIRPGILAAVFLILFALPALAEDQPTYGVGLARVTYINGDALFNSVDSQDWAALSPNFTLRESDRLWAGDNGKMEVGFMGGHFAWLNYDTELDITRLDRSDKSETYQVGLPAGEASFMVRRPRSGNFVFQVDAPNASVRAYDRARFRVSVMSDGSSQIGVSDGSVEVESDKGITDLRPGEMAEIAPDGDVSIASLPALDDWDRWVDSRAQIYVRTGRSARYLPADMDAYAYEFDQGGRWVSAPDYGSVWVPAVAPGWSPYSNGRWCWIAGDYVWVPYDPWYACFHYGRWAWAVSIGWFWVPPPVTPIVFWSPGYVSWVWGPDYVGWVPLAPGEIYYGYGYYGPHSVNIYKTKVVNVTNVYINSRVNNGVIVVNRNNFISGRTERVVIRDPNRNPFLHPRRNDARLIAAPPIKEIKPTRDLILPRPSVRPAPKALPPARVQKLVPVVTKRPLAVKKDESVFKKGAAPQRLNKEVLKQRRPAKPAPFRGREAAPAAPGRELKGRQAPPERQVRPERPARPEKPGPGIQEREAAPPRERVAPERGGGRNLEMPGRVRPVRPRAPEKPSKKERGIEPAPGEPVQPAPPAPPAREEGVRPGRRGIERAPEAAPETRPAPPREEGLGRPQVRPEREVRPAPEGARGGDRRLEQPGRVRPAEPNAERGRGPEDKVKGEGRKKEPKEDKKEKE